MHAQVARVMKGLVVKPPQLMETLSALVRKAGLEMTALWMSMSAMKVSTVLSLHSLYPSPKGCNSSSSDSPGCLPCTISDSNSKLGLPVLLTI